MNVPAGSTTAPSAVTASGVVATPAGALAVFLAALGPMVTVPAIRRLVIDGHGGSPSSVHLFVAAGMVGAAVGAPIIAARVDTRGDYLRVAAVLAAIDAMVQLATSFPIPTGLLYLLRPVHGMASMSLLALLFAQFRRSGGGLVAQAGSAMVAALAVGPAIGGIVSKFGPGLPFRAAAVTSAVLAVVLGARATLTAASAAAPLRRARGSLADVARPIAAPLLVAASQRFAIGGFVAAFAVQARAVHGLSDAKVGACFSTLLVVFAVALVVLGRKREATRLARLVPMGGALFGASFVALAFAPRVLLGPALGAAGIGAALVYAPCLALVSVASHDRARGTSMALLHAAGAAGMIAGPLAGALADFVLRDASVPLRSAAFMAFAGTLHAVTAVALSPRLLSLANSVSIPSASQNEGIS